MIEFDAFFFQFIKFGIVGLSNTFISYAVYATLTFLGIPYLLANVAGFLLSVLNAFFWNNRYVFRKPEDESRSLWCRLAKTFLPYAGTAVLSKNTCQVIEMVKTDYKPEFGKFSYSPMQSMYLVTDISELTADTSWKPEISFIEGIKTIQEKMR